MSLREQQTFDAVDVRDPLGGQDSPLTADAALILLSASWRPNPRLPALVGQKRAHQGFTVDLVGLRPPPPARRCDRCWIDNVALDPFGLQHPVDPKAIADYEPMHRHRRV